MGRWKIFFLSWPQPSAQEIVEQQKAEMEKQLKAMAPFLDDEDAPDDLDDDVDDLPLDAEPTLPKKKKKVARSRKRPSSPKNQRKANSSAPKMVSSIA